MKKALINQSESDFEQLIISHNIMNIYKYRKQKKL